MTSRPPSGGFQPQQARPPCSGGATIRLAVAFFLALAVAQAASARSIPALDDFPAHAASSLLEDILSDAGQVEPALIEDDVRLAMLELGPMLYALALGDDPDHAPPPRRGYAIWSGVWIAAFVVLVSTSAAMAERRALMRRGRWRRRALAFYQ